ncbi:ABC transporter ATP-binding protein [Psychroserpens burtonensis]|uniref:ABC transporter ATP-binding protein n=1 Tax=Psychroserpens burtonensis TaxID=49278 RepID=A0A5C7BAJ5_9FLAO|nr:ABC transporter ATP-binding protein [Psychroserpens burtonensis]TXE17134.1 ABC transporter ATP-binding protein [Psychroserpens burtonensis]
MSDIILKAENISKQYRLGVVGTGTISHDLNRWWHRIRGKEDPFLKVGAVNDRSIKANSDYVWALKDINFEVKRGEVLGIIGKNGAGKSTLLKILSRVTIPTTGDIKTKGRIASLLEVGTGFHPELTGRENIYLNGAILGMTKAEIRAKEEEIIEFSGCQMYVDTPVKRYSSGMRVRLAFAVAAFLEPDILVIDEVLAVGDAEFQKKAIGKMQDISKGDGRTVLFVSHNMATVKSLCTRAVVLEHGETVFEGGTDAAVDYYLNHETTNTSAGKINLEDDDIGNEEVQLIEVTMTDQINRIRSTYLQSEPIEIGIVFLVKAELIGMRFNLSVKNSFGVVAFVTSSHELTKDSIVKGRHTLRMFIPAFLLNNMQYTLAINAGIPGRKSLIDSRDILTFVIESEYAGGSTYIEKWPGLVSPKLEWTLDE